MKRRLVLKKKFVIFLLVYFVFFTSYFSLFTLSKYVGTTEKEEVVTVARWEVALDTSASSDTLNMISGVVQSYKLKVISSSEVALNYSITLSNVPQGLEVSLDNGDFITTTDGKIKYTDVGVISANDETGFREHTLIFNAPLDLDFNSVNEIILDVSFEQIEI